MVYCRPKKWTPQYAIFCCYNITLNVFCKKRFIMA